MAFGVYVPSLECSVINLAHLVALVTDGARGKVLAARWTVRKRRGVVEYWARSGISTLTVLDALGLTQDEFAELCRDYAEFRAKRQAEISGNTAFYEAVCRAHAAFRAELGKANNAN